MLLKHKLVSAYRNNLEARVKEMVEENDDNIMSDIQRRSIEEDGENRILLLEERELKRKWATSWFQQFSVLLRRGMKERRHESFSGLKIGQVLAVSIITGLLWYKSKVFNLQDQVSFLYFHAGPFYCKIYTQCNCKLTHI